MAFRDSNKCRFNKITKTLQSVVNNVLGLSKSGGDSEMLVRLKAAKLKKERLHALALVAESQAVLAETEVLLAELELNEELKDLKRKSPSHEDGRNPKRLKTSAETNAKAKTNTDKRPQRCSKATQSVYRRRGASTPKPTSPRRQKNHERARLSPLDETLVIADPIAAITSTEKCQRSKPVIILNNPPLRSAGKNNLGYISSTKEIVEFHRNDRKYNPLLNIPFYPSMAGKPTALSTKEATHAKDKPKNVWQDRHLDSMIKLLNQSTNSSCAENVNQRLDFSEPTKEDGTLDDFVNGVVKLEVGDDESSNSLDRLIMALED